MYKCKIIIMFHAHSWWCMRDKARWVSLNSMAVFGIPWKVEGRQMQSCSSKNHISYSYLFMITYSIVGSMLVIVPLVISPAGYQLAFTVRFLT